MLHVKSGGLYSIRGSWSENEGENTCKESPAFCLFSVRSIPVALSLSLPNFRQNHYTPIAAMAQNGDLQRLHTADIELGVSDALQKHASRHVIPPKPVSQRKLDFEHSRPRMYVQPHITPSLPTNTKLVPVSVKCLRRPRGSFTMFFPESLQFPNSLSTHLRTHPFPSRSSVISSRWASLLPLVLRLLLSPAPQSLEAILTRPLQSAWPYGKGSHGKKYPTTSSLRFVEVLSRGYC